MTHPEIISVLQGVINVLWIPAMIFVLASIPYIAVQVVRSSRDEDPTDY